MPDVFAIVLAGGEGKRLAPLTARPRQARRAVRRQLPADRLRALEPRQRGLPPHRRPHAVQEPLARPPRRPRPGGCRRCSATTSTPVPAQMRRGPRWFAGSADAIYQNFNLINDERPEYIFVFGADHIYRMDPRQMVEQHIALRRRRHGRRAPRADRAGRPVRRHRDRPRRPHDRRLPREAEATPGGCPTRPTRSSPRWATTSSRAEALIEAVTARRRRTRPPSTTSAATSSRCSSSAARPSVYDFASNEVPGATDRDRGYWRDVGTLDAYYDAHMDLISVDPIFNLYNQEWPILTWPDPLPPAKFVFEDEGRTGAALDSMVCAGVVISGAHRAPLGPLARRAPALLRARRGLGPHARRRRRPQRGRAPRDPRQERQGRAGRADRRRPRGRPRALHRLRRRHRRDPQGPDAWRHERCASRCSRASTRRTSTAAPACTSSTSRASSPRLEDVTVHAWGDARRRGGGPPVVATGPGTRSPAPSRTSRRCARCRSTSTMAAGAAGQRRRPQPHLVRQPRRPPGQARPRHPARRDGAQPRAAAAVEGRAARRRLRAVELLRAHGARGGRRGHRGLAGHARATSSTPIRPSTRAACEVIYNGIDTDEYAPDPGTDVLERHGIDPGAPSVVFVGRITRQKGVAHLLEACATFDPDAQLVLCAGAPDTPEIAAEVRGAGRAPARAARRRDLDRGDAAQAGRDPDPQPRDGLRLPVDLRAAGHRQPRGDGLRDGGRRDGDRRHRRGRRGRRHGPARARSSRGDDGTARAGRPGGLRARDSPSA